MPIDTNFTQTRFLGASVISATQNLGLNNQPTSMTIELVEDLTSGDVFTPPLVGTPVAFSLNSFIFAGLFQSWTKTNETSSYPTYVVTLTDPRELLDGVQLILDSYTGATNTVPNLFNVYGHLESFSFGNSRLNDGGIPWYLIRSAIGNIINNQNGNYNGFYGGPYIYFRGYQYSLDLTDMPNPPNFYRLGGSPVSLLECLIRVCQDCGFDLAVRLQISPIGNLITVKTINRMVQVPLGQLSLFTQDTANQVIHSEVGQELRNEVTNTFLVGGNIQTIYPSRLKYYRSNGQEIDTLRFGINSDGAQDIPLFNGTNLVGIVKYPSRELYLYYPPYDQFNPDFIGTFDSNYNIKHDTYGVFILNKDGRITREPGRTDDKGRPVSYPIGRLSWQKQSIIDNTKTTIAPYWGLDAGGNVVVGNGHPHLDSYSMTIDSRGFRVVGIGPTYTTTNGELRAALISQDEWESYVKIFNPDVASAVGIEGVFRFNPVGTDIQFLSVINDVGATSSLNQNRVSIINTSAIGLGDVDANITLLYNYVRNFAQEYYGRKYMVIVPQVSAQRESETNRLILSHETSDGGFIENGEIPLGIPQIYEDIFQLEDGRFGPVVRFDSVHYLDTSNLKEDSYVLTDSTITSGSLAAQRLFINASVEPNLVFLDQNNLIGPRAVVTIDAPVVKVEYDKQLTMYTEQALIFAVDKMVNSGFFISDIEIANSHVLFQVINGINTRVSPHPYWANQLRIANYADPIPPCLRVTFGPDGNPVMGGSYNWQSQNGTWFSGVMVTSAEDRLLESVNSRFSGKNYAGMHPIAIVPDFIGVPLVSNVLTYGPWYANGAIGRVSYEQDQSLVPWNYGGYVNMNAAAIARLQGAVTNLQVSEMGSVTVPGVPTLPVGDVFVAAGPPITGIDIKIGGDGVVTTYRMQTYVPRFGVFDKANADRILKLNKSSQEARKQFRYLFRQNSGGGQVFQNRAEARYISDGRVISSKSPHPAMVGANTFGSGSRAFPHVSTITELEGFSALRAFDVNKYQATALMSDDGIFRPFSVDPNNIYLSHFSQPATGATFPTVCDLNPFATGNLLTNSSGVRLSTDIKLLASRGSVDRDNQFYTGGSGVQGSTIRALGLRGPVIISGWGYDTNGNPVPNATPNSPSNAFASGYRFQSQNWPCGPLDVRWDVDRKVWAAAGGSTVDLYVVVAQSGFYPNTDSPTTLQPRYCVRPATNFSSDGQVIFDVNTPAGSGANDKLVFNITEQRGDIHTIGLYSAVLLYNKFSQYFMDELPRTFARKQDY